MNDFNPYAAYNPAYSTQNFSGNYGANNFSNYQQQTPQPQNNQNGINSQIKWVQGENGAKSYSAPPNSKTLLFDSESDTFYIKTVDSFGRPGPLEIYDFKRRDEPQQSKQATEPIINSNDYVTKDELNEILKQYRRRYDK